MRARIDVTLKNGVLDPQGRAIASGLKTLGFDTVTDARQGKVIELDLDMTDKGEAQKQVEAMCEQLLANTVIERYSITLED